MSFPVSSTPMTRHLAATYAGRMGGGSSLAVIVELHLPTPLGAVSGVPPALEDADLTAGEDHRTSEILLRWSQVLPSDSAAVAAEPSHRPIGRAGELVSAGHDLARVVADLDVQSRHASQPGLYGGAERVIGGCGRAELGIVLPLAARP
jgi:hypothetical protein